MKISVLTLFKIVILLIVVAAAVALGVTSNEARKEVYYLCKNFHKGVPLHSVIAQLDTIKLSHYSISGPPEQKEVVHSSRLNFDMYRCTIVFDESQRVVWAKYD